MSKRGIGAARVEKGEGKVRFTWKHIFQGRRAEASWETERATGSNAHLILSPNVIVEYLPDAKC